MRKAKIGESLLQGRKSSFNVLLACIPLSTQGGNFTHLLELSSELTIKGNNVTFLISQEIGSDIDFIKKLNGIGRVYVIKSKNTLGRIIKSSLILPIIVKERRIDVVQCYNFHSELAIILYKVYAWHSRLKGIANLYCLEGDIAEYEASSSKKLVYKKLFKLAKYFVDYFIAIGAYTREQYLSYDPKIQGKITVIHSGISDSFLSSSKKVVFAFSRHKIRLGFVGGLSFPKGIRTALQVYKTVKRILPTELHIYGDGYLKEYVELEAEKDIDIHYHGFVNDKARIYTSFEILLFPSIAEGLPWTVIEAMANGRIVLSNRVGAVPDVIDDGVNGYIVSNNAEFAAIASLIIVGLDEHSAYGLSNNARKRIEEYFSASNECVLFLDLYEKTMKNHNNR